LNDPPTAVGGILINLPELGKMLGHSQYHLAVAGGYAVGSDPKRLRTRPLPQVVLTVPNRDFSSQTTFFLIHAGL
jgi:hypothetical protein